MNMQGSGGGRTLSCPTHSPVHQISPLAGQKRCAPHLTIPGVMQTPRRHFSDKGPRRALKLIVFISSVAGVFVKELTGTSYEGSEAVRKYEILKSKQVKQATSMTGEEYMDCVQAAWQHFSRMGAFRHRAGHAMLVHDKSRVHMSGTVVQGLQCLKVAHAVQPARSPDFMPLDYGIFGTAKNQLEAALPKNAKWEAKVAMFKQLLMKSEAAAAIAQFPLRLHACIISQGEHFGDELMELKRRRKRKAETWWATRSCQIARQSCLSLDFEH